MNSKLNDSYESRQKNASHDQSRNSAYLPHEKTRHGKDDKGEEGDPRETLKETFALAKRLLVDGQIQQAIEHCMKGIKDSNSLFGENNIESLPGFFTLIEAHIEEGKLKKAEGFLISAFWSYTKHTKNEKQANQNSTLNQKNEVLDEKESLMYDGELKKVKAKLYEAMKDYNEALDNLKQGIYADSCLYGPEDIQTSISFFNFGRIFIKSGELEKGYSFYNQAIKIWYKFFKILMRNDYDQSQVDDIIIKQGLTLLKGAEVLFLDRIKMEGEQKVIDDIYRLHYALAFMHKYVGEEDVALEYCRNIEGFLLGRYDPNHSKLRRFYEFFPNYQENFPRGENDNTGFNEAYGNRGGEEEEEEEGEEGDQEESENQTSYT